MKTRVICVLFSTLLSLTLMINASITAFATGSIEDSDLSYDNAESLLEAIYEELSFDQEKVEQLSRSSIPAELYIYVDSTLLPFFSSNDSLTISMNYNSDNYSYWTHSDASIVNSYSVYDTVVTSSVNSFTGSFSLVSTPQTSYTGLVTAIRLRASVIGSSLHAYTAPTPVISSLLVGSSDFTALASSFIHMTPRIPGDINCDGYVNDNDSNLLARYLVGDTTANISTAGMISADVDRNGNVDSDDLTLIIQVLGGSVNHF